jgi:hypothetical protein
MSRWMILRLWMYWSPSSAWMKYFQTRGSGRPAPAVPSSCGGADQR